jgi:hypothetical protein
MLSETYLAQSEHRARLSAFNKRAARGDFILYELQASERREPLAVRLRDAAAVVRSALDRYAVRVLPTRAG